MGAVTEGHYILIADLVLDDYYPFAAQFDTLDGNGHIIKINSINTEKYKQAGYKRPNLVWWNVNSRNTQTPITKNDNGNILLSGCSASMLTVALSGEFDPIYLSLESSRR